MWPKRKPEVSQEIVHPVYLDSSMMIDFLASFDDGVSFSSDVARKVDAGRKGTVEGSGTAETGGLADLIGLKISGTGRLGRETTRSESIESKFVRQHTVASLFNRLRLILEERQIIVRPKLAELAKVEPGTLVEIQGSIDRNPLDALSQLYDDFRPYAITQQRRESRDQLPESEYDNPESYEEAVRHAADLHYRDMDEMFEVVKRDLQKGQIIDLPMTASEGVSVLIVASREFYSPQVEAAMLGGTFKVLGKVSGLSVSGERSLPIVRRGAIGLIGEERLQLLVDSMKNSEIEIRVPPLTIAEPWVQLIPLAIYV